MSQSGSLRFVSTEAVTRRLQAVRQSYRVASIHASVRGPLLTLGAVVFFDTLARYGISVPTPFNREKGEGSRFTCL